MPLLATGRVPRAANRVVAFCRKAGLGPISLPLFHGTRLAAGRIKFSSSCMMRTPLLLTGGGCVETDDAMTGNDHVVGRAKPSHEILAGSVERANFHNAENGFCVLRIKARGHRDLVIRGRASDGDQHWRVSDRVRRMGE